MTSYVNNLIKNVRDFFRAHRVTLIALVHKHHERRCLDARFYEDEKVARLSEQRREDPLVL